MLTVCDRLCAVQGLGMLIESDFYTTPAGREHFANQLTSIRYCVQEVIATPGIEPNFPPPPLNERCSKRFVIGFRFATDLQLRSALQQLELARTLSTPGPRGRERR